MVQARYNCSASTTLTSGWGKVSLPSDQHVSTRLVCDPGQVVPQLAGLPLGPVEVRAAVAAGTAAGGR